MTENRRLRIARVPLDDRARRPRDRGRADSTQEFSSDLSGRPRCRAWQSPKGCSAGRRLAGNCRHRWRHLGLRGVLSEVECRRGRTQGPRRSGEPCHEQGADARGLTPLIYVGWPCTAPGPTYVTIIPAGTLYAAGQAQAGRQTAVGGPGFGARRRFAAQCCGASGYGPHVARRWGGLCGGSVTAPQGTASNAHAGSWSQRGRRGRQRVERRAVARA